MSNTILADRRIAYQRIGEGPALVLLHGGVRGVGRISASGEQDRRSPLHVAEDLCARITDARLAVIPGAGHMANVEAAAAFNAHVRAFLRDVGRS